MTNRILLACLLSAAATAAQTVTIQGTVYSMAGEPIEGATCQFKNISIKAMTNAQRKYEPHVVLRDAKQLESELVVAVLADMPDHSAPLWAFER